MGSEAILLFLLGEVVTYSYHLGFRNALRWASALSPTEIRASLEIIERQAS